MNIFVAIPAGVIRDSFFSSALLAELGGMGNVTMNEGTEQLTSQQLCEQIKNVDICITGWGTPRFDEAVLQNANQLKLIAHAGGTVASIVSEAVFEKGIRVLSGNEIFARSVAEGVIAYMLVALRKIPYYMKEMQTTGWRGDAFENDGLLEQTVGIVSFGTISRYVIEMLSAFQVKIKVYSKHLSQEDQERYGIEQVSLEELFSTCKVISVHSASNPQTFHMIDRALLNRIQKGAVLVNTSRGNVIDEQALADVLHENRFRAILDVFEEEPLPMSSALRGLENVMLIPHMGGPTMDRRLLVTKGLLADIVRWQKKEPLWLEISKKQANYMTR
ncbi:MAG: hydroxyacid dehydrogenase [Clostridia bacterium]